MKETVRQSGRSYSCPQSWSLRVRGSGQENTRQCGGPQEIFELNISTVNLVDPDWRVSHDQPKRWVDQKSIQVI